MTDNLVYRVKCAECGAIWYTGADMLKRGVARCPRIGCTAPPVKVDLARDACTVTPSPTDRP